MAESAAFITPSFAPDLELCQLLHESIERLGQGLTHYILVDGSDLRRFSALAGPHTVLVAKEDLLPRGFHRVPHTRRWVCPWTPRPLSGWLVQQIAKLGCLSIVDAGFLVLVDSDTAFIREVPLGEWSGPEAPRLFCAPRAIHASMHRHVEWLRNACRLLGIEDPEGPPYDDYISSLVTWDAKELTLLLERVEATTGESWYRAVARTPQFSEFLLYGLHADHVLGGRVSEHDEDDRCLTYWEPVPLDRLGVQRLAAQRAEGDVAVMVTSHSGPPLGLRRSLLSELAESANPDSSSRAGP